MGRPVQCKLDLDQEKEEKKKKDVRVDLGLKICPQTVR